MKATSVLVLDACALLRYLLAEPGGLEIKALFQEHEQGRIRLLMHPINAGEVVYLVAKKRSLKAAERVRAELGSLPIEMVSFNDELLWEAVDLKSRYAISYADSFAAALAIRENATLLSSDTEFDALGPLVKRQKI